MKQHAFNNLTFVWLLLFTLIGFNGFAADGEALYKSKCATCHQISKDGTGPMLQNVRQKWLKGGAKPESIYLWVANWSAAASSDPYAEEVAKVKPTAMSNFPDLLDKKQDIDAIFDYVDAQVDANKTSSTADQGLSYGDVLLWTMIVLLGIVALFQTVRMSRLARLANNSLESDVSDKENSFNAVLLFLFMFLFFGFFIYLVVQFGWTGLGDSASEAGVGTDWLMSLNLIIITAVVFLMNTMLFVFAFIYRRKPGVKAYYFPHDNRLELVWTVIPAIVLAVIIILGLKSWNDQTSDASEEAIRVELYAKQFDWTVRYAGKDNRLGFFDYKLTSDNNPLALVTSETIQNAIDSMEFSSTGIKALERNLNQHAKFSPEELEKIRLKLKRQERILLLLRQMKARHSKANDKWVMDDIVLNANDTLFLMKDQEYEFNFRSKDIIHSAYFPHFRAQMNTVPGMTTRYKLKPTVSTSEMKVKMNNPNFNYVLMCNKICGSSHYKMKLMVVVLDKKDYEHWMNLAGYNDSKEQQIGLLKQLGHAASRDERQLLRENSKLFTNVYPLYKKLKTPINTPF